jgi:hypothetical protein
MPGDAPFSRLGASIRRKNACATRGVSRTSNWPAATCAHALRSLHRHPGYSAAAVLSLALGIGTNTAVFSLLDALVLRPLPYPEAERLVHLYQARVVGGRFSMGSV